MKPISIVSIEETDRFKRVLRRFLRLADVVLPVAEVSCVWVRPRHGPRLVTGSDRSAGEDVGAGRGGGRPHAWDHSIP